MPHGAAHAGTRQFAVDMAAHGIADRLDILRDCRFATLTQSGRVRGQGRQRRLQSVSEIGCAAARACDLLFLSIKQGIDLSLIHISEPTRRTPTSYAVFCL